MGTLSPDNFYDDCPECDTNLYVVKSGRPDADWYCHRCAVHFIDGEVLWTGDPVNGNAMGPAPQMPPTPDEVNEITSWFESVVTGGTWTKHHLPAAPDDRPVCGLGGDHYRLVDVDDVKGRLDLCLHCVRWWRGL